MAAINGSTGPAKVEYHEKPTGKQSDLVKTSFGNAKMRKVKMRNAQSRYETTGYHRNSDIEYRIVLFFELRL